LELPLRWLRDHLWTRQTERPPFVQRATFFEWIVTRCVKWAFTNMDPEVGRVFLGPTVASRFLGFRMFHNLYWSNPFVRHRVGEGKGVSLSPPCLPDLDALAMA
jgi:hypothetical protein